MTSSGDNATASTLTVDFDLLVRDSHGVQVAAAERNSFRSPLHFHQTGVAGHDDVHVSVAAGVFKIIKIKHWYALVHANRDRCNMTEYRRRFYQLLA